MCIFIFIKYVFTYMYNVHTYTLRSSNKPKVKTINQNSRRISLFFLFNLSVGVKKELSINMCLRTLCTRNKTIRAGDNRKEMSPTTRVKKKFFRYPFGEIFRFSALTADKIKSREGEVKVLFFFPDEFLINIKYIFVSLSKV